MPIRLGTTIVEKGVAYLRCDHEDVLEKRIKELEFQLVYAEDRAKLAEKIPLPATYKHGELPLKDELERLRAENERLKADFKKLGDEDIVLRSALLKAEKMIGHLREGMSNELLNGYLEHLNAVEQSASEQAASKIAIAINRRTPAPVGSASPARTNVRHRERRPAPRKAVSRRGQGDGRR